MQLGAGRIRTACRVVTGLSALAGKLLLLWRHLPLCLVDNVGFLRDLHPFSRIYQREKTSVLKKSL